MARARPAARNRERENSPAAAGVFCFDSGNTGGEARVLGWRQGGVRRQGPGWGLIKGGRPGLGVRVQEGISPEITARRVSNRRGERDDRRGRVAGRQERERAIGVRGAGWPVGQGGRRAAQASGLLRETRDRASGACALRACLSGLTVGPGGQRGEAGERARGVGAGRGARMGRGGERLGRS